MIDFIKLHWKDKSQFEPFVRDENKFQNLYSVLENHTGEIKYPYRTYLNNLKVQVNKKSGYLKNSIHKLYNILDCGEDQNYNDFTYSKLRETIDYLYTEFPDIKNARLPQFEFGLNISTPIPAEQIINRNLLMHDYTGYDHKKRYFGKGKLKQFDHTNYAIKVYDKAKQFNLDQNILRIELKFRNSKDFNKFGIFKLSDLKDKAKLQQLFGLLIRRFEELIIVDQVQKGLKITAEETSKYNLYRNPQYWEEDIKIYSRQTESNKKKDFSEILKKCHLLNTKNTLRDLITNKFNWLMDN